MRIQCSTSNSDTTLHRQLLTRPPLRPINTNSSDEVRGPIPVSTLKSSQYIGKDSREQQSNRGRNAHKRTRAPPTPSATHAANNERREPQKTVERVEDEVRLQTGPSRKPLRVRGEVLVQKEEGGLDRVDEDECCGARARHGGIGYQRAAYDECHQDEKRLRDVDSAVEAVGGGVEVVDDLHGDARVVYVSVPGVELIEMEWLWSAVACAGCSVRLVGGVAWAQSDLYMSIYPSPYICQVYYYTQP
jgi:hypothetical protein